MEDVGGCRADDLNVSAEEAMLELEKLLADARFRASDRNKRFLRYVMEKLFNGSADQIKAYSIAIDVFGRPADFDPVLDPIVRIEATRLRASLSHYYELYGQDHALRIDLPKGGYVPVVLRLRPPPTVDVPSDGKSKSNLRLVQFQRLAKPLGRNPPWFFTIVGALTSAFLILITLWFSNSLVIERSTFSEKPTALLSVTVNGKAGIQAQGLSEKMIIALAQFRTINLLRNIDDDRSSDHANRLASGVPPDTYLIEIDFRPKGSRQEVWWQVSNHASKKILVSRLEPNSSYPSNQDIFVGSLAYQVAGMGGAISSSVLRQEFKVSTLGHGCVLRAYHAIRAPTVQKLETARICLERSLRVQPNNADVYSALSLVLLSQVSTGSPISERTLKLANTAVQLAPNSAASARAQMETLFRAGQVEAAVTAGRRALTLNPFDNDTIASFAAFLSETQNWGKSRSEGQPPESAISLAL